MATLQKLKLTKVQKTFIDNLVRNAYMQGHHDGFSISGKHFNGISGMLQSADFKGLTISEANHFMNSHDDFFKDYYTLKNPDGDERTK